MSGNPVIDFLTIDKNIIMTKNNHESYKYQLLT